MLVFDRLVLDVENLDRSLRFYTEELDFQVAGQLSWEGHRTVILQLGAFHLLLLEQPHEQQTNYHLPKAGPVVGLADAKIDARSTALERAGVDIISPLKPSPWGGRSMMILDPDGYLIMIQEPRAAPDELMARSPADVGRDVH